MGGPPLLNANQKRRISTILRLLKEDLEEMVSWREMERPGQPFRSVRESVTKLLASVESLREVLALPEYRAPSLARRVGATAEVWAISAEDMKTDNLRGYGELNAHLSEVLDGPVDAIVMELRHLAELARQLPER